MATASHELRTPTTVVLGFAETMHDRWDVLGDEQRRGFLRLIVDSARQLSRLIEDLLMFSRVGGPAEVRPVPVDCALVLGSVLESLAVVLAESQALVTHDPLPVVYADPIQISQLLQNLIENAIKFHCDEPPHVHVAARRDGNKWVFCVRDNGIGLQPEALVGLFRLFSQVDASHDRSRGGLGIGLALVKSLVELHGGTVWASSDGPGRGSEFTVRLPL